MAIVFEWDIKKAQTNLIKHKVSFEEVASIFADHNSLTIDDPLHSLIEKRNITIGVSFSNRLLIAVHTVRNNKIRIISARIASRKEKKQYEL